MIIKKYEEIEVSTCNIKNLGDGQVLISSPTMLDINIDVQENATLNYFASDWGDEFSPRNVELNDYFHFDAKKGRSAKHANPTFYIEDSTGVSLFHIAWSGNFRAEFTKISNTQLNIKVSLEEGFETILNPNTSFDGFDVIYVLKKKSLNEASQLIHKYVRENIYSNINYIPPLVWNHWWTYEDLEITEEIFRDNVDVASEVGFEYAMLDAGWFGETNEFWELIRGDWHVYNKIRFPSGIRHLSDYVKSKGMKFGIWIELEGLGVNSDIYKNKPWLVAKDNDKSLEYICLGSERNQQWALEQFKMLIEDFGAEYIKLDFNLDPQKGCSCTDHDHGRSDGLYYHYKGLYKVLKIVKTLYPDVILENCSSGGLRADLALMENMDVCFMSDPDYTEHSHQCYQGFRLFLPPERVFHFSWSHAIDKGRYAIPQCDFNNKNLSEEFKKYTIRSVSQHAFGMSHPLINYSDEDLNLIADELKLHRELINIINQGKLYTNKTQTIKNFQGERNPYYVYEKDEDILVFCYGLEMAEDKQVISFKEIGIEVKELEVVKQIDAKYKLGGDTLTVYNKQQTASIILIKNSYER